MARRQISTSRLPTTQTGGLLPVKPPIREVTGNHEVLAGLIWKGPNQAVKLSRMPAFGEVWADNFGAEIQRTPTVTSLLGRPK
jgi:hypothetical protein